MEEKRIRMSKKKLAIIGASYLQEPLIEKAEEMGIETHVFAWEAHDVGEESADFFYPISIVEKEQIADKCAEIGVDGICTIATDLGAITVNYVAKKLGLIGNSSYCARVSTNKEEMRECFRRNNDPSPKSMEMKGTDLSDDEIDQMLSDNEFSYPVIVKPTDRSGSRGITELSDKNGISAAVKAAAEVGFEKKVLIEEFATGQEYSVEYISWQGEHHFLALTQKYTTGSPHFIETGHLEPAPVSDEVLEKVKQVVEHALTSLDIKYGASHSEIKIAPDGTIRIIEIGGRMGGDFIGSSLVQLSTGVDFVKAVIQVALGEEPDLKPSENTSQAGVRFVFSDDDLTIIDQMEKDPAINIVYREINDISGTVSDSSSRFGCVVFIADDIGQVIRYLPEKG